MGDLDYSNYQNLAEQLMGESHAGTIAQYQSIINDPAQLGQHLLGDAGAFLLHDKVRDGIKGISFFQKPLGLGIKQFGKDLLKNVKQDIIDSLSTITVN